MFEDCFYAAKGKNTDEFYRHSLPSKEDAYSSSIPISDGSMNNQLKAGEFKLKVSPNPANNNTVVKYSLPTPGEVSLKLYNITGVLVKSYNNSISTPNGIIHIETKTMPSGVYILRLISGSYQASRKLIIQK